MALDVLQYLSLLFGNYLIKKKLNLHYTRGITLKRVTSDGPHLCGSALGLTSSEETSQL